MMICLTGLKTLSADNNFNPIKQGDLYCFSKSEAFELINSYDIMIDLKKDNLYQSNKIILQSKELNIFKTNQIAVREQEKAQKKKRVKMFFNGVAVGSGVTIIGLVIVIVKIAL
jgi:hypothetical protein